MPLAISILNEFLKRNNSQSMDLKLEDESFPSNKEGL
jgi:hypothetical protein